MNTPAGESPSTRNAPFSKDRTITVSIVICTLNRPDALRNCLAAIALLDPAPDDLLIVDNTAGEDATKALALEFGARYTIEPVRGLSRARNRGLSESSSEIVAFLDDDAIADPHWLGGVVAPFTDPSVAAAAGKIRTPDSGTKEPAAENVRVLSNKDPRWFEIATFGGMGLGSNMALRKEACAGRRIFDERLGRGAPFQIAEESYAFAVLLSLGYKAVYVPDAIVFHPPMRRSSIEQEARNSVSYWFLLFSEFSDHRLDLLRFLIRRLLRMPLTWPRDPQGPGEIINSSWRVKWGAAVSGALHFLRTPKPPDKYLK